MKQHQAGFTLLEMLVALVVFGLVMAGIAQAFHFGFTALYAGNRAIQSPEDLAAMDMALRRMLEQAQADSMTGGPYAIAFTTNLPQGAGPIGGLEDVALQLGPGGTLLLRYTPHPPGRLLDAAPPPKTDILATGIKGVSFSYLQAAPDSGIGWGSKWSGAGLPSLIRMHLERDGGSWPDLIAAPAAQGN